MKRIALLCILLIVIYNASAQELVYDTAAIPAAVKNHANMVMRYENTLFEVKDIDRAYLDVETNVTILNDAAKGELVFKQFLSKYEDLTEVEIRVFDAKGKPVGKYHKSDMHTTAYGDGLIEEGMVTYFVVPAPAYPVTIHTQYQIKYKGTLQYPSYRIQGVGEGVESSAYTVKIPKEMDLRFKESNIKLSPQIKTDDKTKTYSWSVKNLAPLEYEEGAVSYGSGYPAILIAPNRFKIYNTEGDMSTWKNFGNWERGLIQGLEVLPPDRIQFFQNMVKNATDDREKIRLVYDYLQKNFRYVSIQLGIGGYKPFPAVFTDSKKYGDCKGLSFYTYSVLKALGIKSYVALINAEYNKAPVDPNFPCNQFNHMILCVPQQKDSIWLECTSTSNDFAVLGNATENRNALLITENGGVLVPTPRSKSSDNTFNANTKIVLTEDGAGKTETRLLTTGEYKQTMINSLFNEKKDDQKDMIVNYYGFKQPDVFSINKTEEGNQFIASLTMEIEKVPEFIAGSKMFLNPRLYKLWSSKLPKAENRRLDYYFPHPFEKTDSSIYVLPPGYTADALPAEKNYVCEFASYSTKYWYSAATKSVYGTAKLILKQNVIPAAKYTQVKNFFDDVLKEDGQRIVIRKE